MSEWKRRFGLDGFDTAVHLVITAAVMLAIADATRAPGAVALAGAAGFVVFAFRRKLALGAMVRTGEISGESTGVGRALDTEARLAELEQLYARVAELEERLDFSERLLAQKDEVARFEAPRA